MFSPFYIKIFTDLIRSIPRDKRGSSDSKTPEHYLSKIFYVLKNGISWSQLVLHKDDLHFTSYYKKFIQYRNHNIFRDAYYIIIKLLQKNKILNPKALKNLYIDASLTKNIYGVDNTGSNYYDRNRSSNKISVVVTSTGIPIGIKVAPGNVSDIKMAMDTVDDINIKIVGSRLIADKGYVSSAFTETLKSSKITLITPIKSNQRNKKPLKESEKQLLSKRNIVENFFSWLKQCRRIRHRYDSNFTSYLAFIYLGLIKIIAGKVKL